MCFHVFIRKIFYLGATSLFKAIVINLSTGIPYLLTILVLNSEIVYYLLMCLKYIAICMANTVDPDQMPQNAASDLGLHCLQKPICPNT